MEKFSCSFSKDIDIVAKRSSFIFPAIILMKLLNNAVNLSSTPIGFIQFSTFFGITVTLAPFKTFKACFLHIFKELILQYAV